MTQRTHTTGDMKGLREEPLSDALLKAVSRSFYLSMAFLPKPMRRGIALGYMLARATDSVADTSTANSQRREAVLRAMGCSVAAHAAVDGEEILLADLAGAMAEAQQKPSEAELLRRFGDCLSALRALPEGEAKLVRRVLATIIEGQIWDITYFRAHQCVSCDDETRQYTYSVAGCVGEFWTRLGVLTLGRDFCEPDRLELMVEAGVRYGRGLQLINILRDRGEDEQRGRRYLCSDPLKWMDRTERYLRDGLDYSRRLRRFSLRFASMLPALIGLKTLRLIRSGSPGGRVKIPRCAVYASMLRALWISAVGHIAR